MLKSTVTLSVLAGLLLAGACAHSPSVGAHAGRLALTLEAAGPSDDALPVAVAITGLSRSYTARVALAAEGTTQLELPAGLYAVEGASDTLASVSSAPQLVVVSSGGVSRVHVRDVSKTEIGELSALDVDSAGR